MKKGLMIQRTCIILGIGLLVGAIVTLVLWQWGIHSSEQRAAEYADIIEASIPEPRDTALEERRDNTMSVLAIDGTDFLGVIEIPRYDSVLPVGAEWGSSEEYPCRFTGSIYDGTMRIGATTQKGQYDFHRELSVGDTVVYTDVEGNRYTYEITSLRNEGHADQAALERYDAQLVLFIKNIYSFEYLMVFCSFIY